MKKLTGLAAVAALALIAGVAVAVGAKPPTLAKVKADFVSNPEGPRVTEFRTVTPTEALTQRFENGRMGTVETTGEVEQTIATEVPSSPLAGDVVAAAAERCWYVEWKVGMGIVPYERDHHAATYWCAVYGSHITYSRTNTRGSTNGFCSTTGTGSWRMSGGPGYFWVKKHTWSSFSCPTPWWWSLNDTLWMNISYNSWGNSAVEESHPS